MTVHQPMFVLMQLQGLAYQHAMGLCVRVCTGKVAGIAKQIRAIFEGMHFVPHGVLGQAPTSQDSSLTGAL